MNAIRISNRLSRQWETRLSNGNQQEKETEEDPNRAGNSVFGEEPRTNKIEWRLDIGQG